MIKAPPAVSFIGTFGLTLLAIAGLFTFDTFLAKVDQTENDVEAVRLFRQGQAFLSRGDDLKAIDSFSDAIEIDRNNRDYQRSMAQAQLAAGRTSDAESTLQKLLEVDSADGQASLLMARALMKEEKFPAAISFFHRAVYGHWNSAEQENRLKARNELIDLLAQRNAKEELLAELLAMQWQAPKDVAAQTRLGDLFLQAGSPARALDVFHNILRQQPSNVQAHKGLGEAEFAQGNYRTAERDFQTALKLAPNDNAIQQKLELSNQVLQLDPTVRGLSTDERFRRSSQVLEMTVKELAQCSANAELLDKANTALTQHVPLSQQSEVAEANLDLAEQLWQVTRKQCQSPPDANSPLALVLARQTQ